MTQFHVVQIYMMNSLWILFTRSYLPDLVILTTTRVFFKFPINSCPWSIQIPEVIDKVWRGEGKSDTRRSLARDCTSLVSNKSAGNVISCRLDPRLGAGRSALSLDSSFHVDAGLLVASVTHLALPGIWTIHACRLYTVPCYAFDYRQCAQHVENVPRVHKREGPWGRGRGRGFHEQIKSRTGAVSLVTKLKASPSTRLSLTDLTSTENPSLSLSLWWNQPIND